MAKANNQIAGLTIRFYPNDHEPHHFHVEKTDEWEIKVYFRLTNNELTYDVCWPKNLALQRRYREELCEYVNKFRVELEQEWEQKVQQ